DLVDAEAAPTVRHWIAWTVLAVAALVGVSVVILLRMRRGGMTPIELAQLQFRRLQEQNSTLSLPQAYGQLSKIVREYLQNRFEIPAVAQTTEELTKSLSKLSALDPRQVEVLTTFLAAADQARYAGAVSQLSSEAAIGQAASLVDQIDAARPHESEDDDVS
ncbi:MAG: hypothetical protein MI861_07995, partial [Pirellulales bacterium]|nr:hypothetical protein [Pirellulales bacterium]